MLSTSQVKSNFSTQRAVRIGRLLRPLFRKKRPPAFALAVVVAIVAGFALSLLRMAIDSAVAARHDFLDFLPFWAAPIAIVAFPILGAFIASALMLRYAPETKGSGIQQVKHAYHLRGGMLAGRTAFAKFGLASLTIGSGLSFGHEGPGIQIGAALGSAIGQKTAASRARVRQLTAVGASCGLAAAFGAPIASIMFLLEEVVGDFRHELFGFVIVAVVVATAIAANLVGDLPLLGVLQHSFSGLDVFAYALLGLSCGLLGRLFVHSFFAAKAWSCKRFGDHKRWQRLLLGSGVTGLLTCAAYLALNVHLIGSSGLHDITFLVTHHYPLLTLVALLFGKIVATIFSNITEVPGGIFGPSLMIGAVFGMLTAGLINLGVPYVGLPTVEVGAFAVVGMAAFFGGVVHAPMTATMIVVEITDDYGLILPLMLATTLSVLVIQNKGSIYDLMLRAEGVVLHVREQAELLTSTTVEQVMTTDVRTLDAELTLDEALKVADQDDESRLYVVQRHGRMVGVVSANDLIWEVVHEHGGMKLLKYVEGRRIVHAHPDQELDSLMEKITHFEFMEFPVVSREDELCVVGVVGVHEINRYREKLDRAAREPQEEPFERGWDTDMFACVSDESGDDSIASDSGRDGGESDNEDSTHASKSLADGLTDVSGQAGDAVEAGDASSVTGDSPDGEDKPDGENKPDGVRR